MHCTYCSVPKGTSRAEAMSNSEQVVLAVIELCQSEGIRRTVTVVSYSVRRKSIKQFLKFRGNISKAFQVNVKAFLSLFLPNKCCPIVFWKNGGWFYSIGHTYFLVVLNFPTQHLCLLAFHMHIYCAHHIVHSISVHVKCYCISTFLIYTLYLKTVQCVTKKMHLSHSVINSQNYYSLNPDMQYCISSCTDGEV